jgi:hypothetical protein
MERGAALGLGLVLFASCADDSGGGTGDVSTGAQMQTSSTTGSANTVDTGMDDASATTTTDGDDATGSTTTGGASDEATSASSTGETQRPGSVLWSVPVGDHPFDAELGPSDTIEVIAFDFTSAFVVSHHDADGEETYRTEYPAPIEVAQFFASTLDVGESGEVVASAGWVGPTGSAGIVHVCAEDCAVTWSLQGPEVGISTYAALEAGAITGRTNSSLRRYDATGTLTQSVPTDPAFVSIDAALSATGDLWVGGLAEGIGVAQRYDAAGELQSELLVELENAAVAALAPLGDGGLVLAGSAGPDDARHGFVRVFTPDGSAGTEIDLDDTPTFDIATDAIDLAVSTTAGVTKYSLAGELVWNTPLGSCRGVDMNTAGDVVAVCVDGAAHLHRLSP